MQWYVYKGEKNKPISSMQKAPENLIPFHVSEWRCYSPPQGFYHLTCPDSFKLLSQERS